MSIKPPSDIVLDVARAADPATLQAATRRLTGLMAAGDAAAQEFASVLGRVGAPTSAALDTPDMQSTTAVTVSQMRPADLGASRPGKAYRGFEAFVLQSFIAEMLPKHAESSFGQGSTGEIWKSFFAEQLGAQLARSGGIGIAQRLAASAAAAPTAVTAAAQAPCDG